MALTREQKQEIIKDLGEKFEKQKSIVFVDFTGTKVKDMSEARKEMKKNDCEFKIAKKTLMKVALKENEMDLPEEDFNGEIGVGFGFKDEVMPFRILGNVSKKTNTLKLLCGLIGKNFIKKEEAQIIAELPDKNELLSKVVGSISSPLNGLVNVLQGNLRGLICVLSAIKK